MNLTQENIILDTTGAAIPIAVVYPNKSSSSETFIQAHINGLPATVHPLYGGWFPSHSGNGPLYPIYQPSNLVSKSIQWVKNKLYGVANKQTEIRKSPLAEKALFNYLVENKIKAVLAEYALTGIAVMDVCKKANIPLIVHFHGFDAYVTDLITRNKKKYVELFSKAAAIVAVSNDMKAQLISLGADEKKVYVNSCGVDINQFQLRWEKPTGFTFLFAGRFVPKKAPQLVITAFSKLCSSVPQAKLLMMGDGSINKGVLYEECKQLVKTLDIEDKVIFTGVYTAEELIKAMPGAFCFIQHSVRPSSGDSEGTPVTLLEAAAIGLPVIATKHGGIKDVVVHGETGFLVEEYDIDSTTAYMLELTKNPDLAFNMGYKGRERVEELYSMDRSIDNLWAIIHQTIV